jgi:membrane fusion protein, heavy metal efflux system
MNFPMIFIAITILFTASCTSNNTALEIPPEHKAAETGHSHDAKGGHIGESGKIPTVGITVWTNKTELFLDFPVLVIGHESRFAAHFTKLDKHQAMLEGTVSVRLIRGDQDIRDKVDAPSSPGLFTLSLKPEEAGIYQLTFEIKAPTLTDKIVMNDVQVFGSIKEAQEAHPADEEDSGAITFLKEQAWKIEFQTEPVVRSEIYEVIHTSGVWKVAPSHYKTLVATTNGTVTFKSGNLLEGSRVKKGQLLMMVSSAGLTSNNLGVEIQKSKVELEQARSEYERKKQLNESKVIPKSELEKAKQKYLIAKSTYETLNAGYTEEGKQVIASTDGYIKSISVRNGAFVDQGATLLTIISQKSSLLEVQVSPSYASQLENIHDIWYQPRIGYWSNLRKNGGSIISVGREVNRDKPLLSVVAKVNDAVEVPEGSFTEAQIAIGNPATGVVIPRIALLENYGSHSVIVQMSGERFERRPVSIGKRNGSEVEITNGLSVGEVLVTKGAYQVKIASMLGQVPAHGHEH